MGMACGEFPGPVVASTQTMVRESSSWASAGIFMSGSQVGLSRSGEVAGGVGLEHDMERVLGIGPAFATVAPASVARSGR